MPGFQSSQRAWHDEAKNSSLYWKQVNRSTGQRRKRKISRRKRSKETHLCNSVVNIVNCYVNCDHLLHTQHLCLKPRHWMRMSLRRGFPRDNRKWWKTPSTGSTTFVFLYFEHSWTWNRVCNLLYFTLIEEPEAKPLRMQVTLQAGNSHKIQWSRQASATPVSRKRPCKSG